MDYRTWYTLISDTMEAYHPFYWDEMRQAIQDSGVPERWFALSLARGAEPVPLSVDRLYEMSPYGAREAMVGNLEELASVELLELVGAGAYRLTGIGREAVESIFGAAHQTLASVQPLGGRETLWLIDLLQRVVAATLTSPQPEAKWAIAYSRWTDPGPDAALAPRIDQYLTDLLRFRDDSHLAAWKVYDVSGPAWEALTFLWRGEAGSAEELAEKLPYRSLGTKGHAAALSELAGRSWAEVVDDTWHPTEEGVRIREEGENETDCIFFGPWVCLSEEELSQLKGLLTRTKERLGEIKGDGEE